MREQIADWIPSPDEKQRNLIAEEILTLFKEQIEKLPTPYPQLSPDLTGQNPTNLANADGFERCRNQMLAQLDKDLLRGCE